MDRLHELAFVAHELGGALSPVRNALDLVRDEVPAPLHSEQRRLLEIAARSLGRAERILRNLHAIAAPETYRGGCETLDARRLLETLRSDFESDARVRNVTLEVESPEEILFPGDPLCLEQILTNLVSNAVKFTPHGGRVTLRAEPPRSGVLPGRLTLLGGDFGAKLQLLTFEVTDTGQGMSEETCRHLFEPFFRGPEAEQVPGMGLGLTVARRLVRLMHGDLRLGTAPQGGTRFVLTLPADAASRVLVEHVDHTIDTLNTALASGPQSLVVLRCGTAAPSHDTARRRLTQELGEPGPGVAELAPGIHVVCTPVPLRRLLHALAAVYASPNASDTHFHAQRAPRSSNADERLLLGLVRCRHLLPPSAASEEEVLDGAHPSGG